MRKSIAVGTLLCSLFIVTSSTADSDGKGPPFEAELTGENELPSPVDTEMTGRLRMKFNDDLTEAEFRLRIRQGVGVTAAHLHCGSTVQNGPVVAFLLGSFPSPGIDVPNGEIDDFVLKDKSILPAGSATDGCPAIIGRSIVTLADLFAAARDGLIYANVHTAANPAGEIRGQLEEAGRRDRE